MNPMMKVPHTIRNSTVGKLIRNSQMGFAVEPQLKPTASVKRETEYKRQNAMIPLATSKAWRTKSADSAFAVIIRAISTKRTTRRRV
jgi:hypothetical protein